MNEVAILCGSVIYILHATLFGSTSDQSRYIYMYIGIKGAGKEAEEQRRKEDRENDLSKE